MSLDWRKIGESALASVVNVLLGELEPYLVRRVRELLQPTKRQPGGMDLADIDAAIRKGLSEVTAGAFNVRAEFDRAEERGRAHPLDIELAPFDTSDTEAK